MQNNVLCKFNLCKCSDILLLEYISMIFSINVLIFVERVLKNILRLSRINYLYDISIFIRFTSTKDIGEIFLLTRRIIRSNNFEALRLSCTRFIKARSLLYDYKIYHLPINDYQFSRMFHI